MTSNVRGKKRKILTLFTHPRVIPNLNDNNFPVDHISSFFVVVFFKSCYIGLAIKPHFMVTMGCLKQKKQNKTKDPKSGSYMTCVLCSKSWLCSNQKQCAIFTAVMKWK